MIGLALTSSCSPVMADLRCREEARPDPRRGFGGLELATRLSETLQDVVRVTLLDRNDSFVFGYSKLEVMLGRQSADDVRLHYRDIDKDGVEFRQETVTGIDPVARRVATDAGSYDADFLVVAMGADYDMDGDAWPRGGRLRVLHGRRRRAAARRAGRLRRRASPRLRARAALQVSAGPVRGGVPVARVLHAAGHPRLGADDVDVPDAAPGPGDRRGLADVPRRARRAGHRGAAPAPRHEHRSGDAARHSLRTAGRCPTTSSSASRSTGRPTRSRPQASRSTAGCPSTRPTSGPSSRRSTPSATSAPVLAPSPRPGSSPSRPRASWPTTSRPRSPAGSRRRRTEGRASATPSSARGSSARSRSTSSAARRRWPAQRPVARVRRREGGVRRDPAGALVRVVTSRPSAP